MILEEALEGMDSETEQPPVVEKPRDTDAITTLN